MKQTAVEWLAEKLEEYGDPQFCEIEWEQLDSLIKQAKEIEKEQENSYSEEVICKHCKKPISVKDINNHLFMAIKGGGLIHWNCKTI
jgi:hypothetical protein